MSISLYRLYRYINTLSVYVKLGLNPDDREICTYNKDLYIHTIAPHRKMVGTVHSI